nr:MAG TPA: hypothetical protein [Caudoviricetes sp.]
MRFGCKSVGVKPRKPCGTRDSGERSSCWPSMMPVLCTAKPLATRWAESPCRGCCAQRYVVGVTTNG